MTTDKLENIMRISEVLLRFIVMIMALVCAVTVGVASENELVIGLRMTADFRLMKSLPCLVIIEGILSGYSLLQGVRCVWVRYKGSILLSKLLAWMIFSCDQVMAYASLAAAASAAESAYLAKNGVSELQWIKVCGFFGRFCLQTGAGIVIGLIAAVCMGALSVMSAYHLFRLYGRKARSS
ncbi:hypothetical protein SUGI_0529300 [Cryptomeria japonica]|nr:CASP-like protein 2BC1 isoform X2 [Cryptomeria japonica]XP_057853623.1 CASP-like protein 2BC1 isoform X2 [Cryptomeria japonica]GLJ27010.1 hypothetical protein SUGI_0529300 [Cryptomeria japonica]